VYRVVQQYGTYVEKRQEQPSNKQQATSSKPQITNYKKNWPYCILGPCCWFRKRRISAFSFHKNNNNNNISLSVISVVASKRANIKGASIFSGIRGNYQFGDSA
jgi:hypothetical protein